MILAWLLLLTGLTISAVAIYYSVVGLAAIFSAAVIPIIVMGSALEVAKLVCASWLKANWSRAPRLMKVYMTTAVIVLMLITSMGIFGILSKAHSDQSLVSGDVMSKIAIYDEKIKTSKDNIEANRKALTQMDAAVDQTMARSTTEQGADKASALRRSQAKERTRLQNEIAAEQKNIAKLNDEAAPIRAEVRKVEAEVGPLKYIAAFVYGETDTTVLEKAVTWVIITIIVVFDPLAVIMLLAAQMTFGWKKDDDESTPDPYVADVGEKPTKEELEEIDRVEPVLPKQFIDHGEHPKDNFGYEQTHTEEVPSETPSTALGGDITAPEEKPDEVVEELPLEQWNKMIEEAEKAVEEEKKKAVEADLPEVDRPGDYLTDTESKKKDVHDEGRLGADTGKEQIVAGYVQNAEQSEGTIWSRINNAGIKPKDEMYRLYGVDKFNDLIIDRFTDPALYQFVEETKLRGPKFANYSTERLKEFASRIYELRKNNPNNTAG